MNIGNAQLSHVISENRRHWPIIQPILFDSIEIPLVYPYSPSDKWESVRTKWCARARRNTRKITEATLSSRVIVWMIALTTRVVLKKLLFRGIPISNPIANAHLSNSVLHFSFNFCLQITLNNLAPKQALSLRSLKTLLRLSMQGLWTIDEGYFSRIMIYRCSRIIKAEAKILSL